MFDGRGKSRVGLSATADGDAGLLFSDENEKQRASIGIVGQSSQVSFMDANGVFRAVLGLTKDVSKIVIQDKTGKPVYVQP